MSELVNLYAARTEPHTSKLPLQVRMLQRKYVNQTRRGRVVSRCLASRSGSLGHLDIVDSGQLWTSIKGLFLFDRRLLVSAFGVLNKLLSDTVVHKDPLRPISVGAMKNVHECCCTKFLR